MQITRTDSLPHGCFPKLICPTGSPFRIPVQSPHQKYFAFSEAQISCMVRVSRFPQEGRLAIVTDVGGGMRWTRERRKTSADHAYGKAVWS